MAKRRGNGEGTITRRKDGRWEARYTAQTAEGPRRKVLYGKTRSEVAQKLTKAMANRNDGLVFDHENLYLDEFLDRWLNTSVRDSVKQNTYESHAYLVRKHIAPALGRVRLRTLNPAHVQGLYREKLDSHLSPRTVELIHTTLHKALGQAVKWELVPRNVADAVQAPRPTKKEINPLTMEQVRMLLSTVRGDRLEALYVVAVTTGLREGELLGLRWQDVDLEQGKVRVVRQLTRTRDGLSFTAPKRNKTRIVRLTTPAMVALRKHKAAQNQERLKAGSLWQDTGLAFTSTIGTPIDVGNLTYRSFRPLLESAGLPRIRFHDLRHTFATLMLSNNEHPKVVQEMLGHSTITQTMDTYSHVLPDMQEQAASRLGSLFS